MSGPRCRRARPGHSQGLRRRSSTRARGPATGGSGRWARCDRGGRGPRQGRGAAEPRLAAGAGGRRAGRTVGGDVGGRGRTGGSGVGGGRAARGVCVAQGSVPLLESAPLGECVPLKESVPPKEDVPLGESLPLREGLPPRSTRRPGRGARHARPHRRGPGDTPGAPHPPTRLAGGAAAVAGGRPRLEPHGPPGVPCSGAASGSAGLALGGGATWMATAEDAPPPPTTAERLAAANHSRRRLAGAPPTPLWRHDVAGGPPACPRSSGRTRSPWSRTTRPSPESTSVRASDSGRGTTSAPGDGFCPSARSRSGAGRRARRAVRRNRRIIQWWPKSLRAGGRTPYAALLAAEGGTVWLAAGRRGSGAADDGLLIAYDLAGREELWRSPLPGGFDEGYPTRDRLVVRGEMFLAFDRERGTQRWRRSYEGVTAGRQVTTDGRETLIAAVGTALRGYGLADGGGPAWSVKAKGETGSGHTADFRGSGRARRHRVRHRRGPRGPRALDGHGRGAVAARLRLRDEDAVGCAHTRHGRGSVRAHGAHGERCGSRRFRRRGRRFAVALQGPRRRGGQGAGQGVRRGAAQGGRDDGPAVVTSGRSVYALPLC
ncbi:PQQ-like domain-containing protein [Streptomyces melanosporofaciens]|uniref:PQQ-like domain-containing protein n=1 Tax=Streptomyces melanosporofaciens TaxID=67327 RepID=A0A1H4ULX9_STRMJ|nr:PQQ-like domain-containing protein [Streptomyces melanosporofaciens]